ncbi:hypothetical protein [Nocardioides sp. TF02-7]|uniref:hypothetical protein n=1 Tax=Nocardioides sp. TF02-7 TaxID=2917724 RepID=UPI001F059CEC|nr:hypothetical protein [Nocardioides sp. TF02-7]UMG94550.1 hypothetical protein MF408_11695 [Nocardioides sp. TF02-7]
MLAQHLDRGAERVLRRLGRHVDTELGERAPVVHQRRLDHVPDPRHPDVHERLALPGHAGSVTREGERGVNVGRRRRRFIKVCR